MKILRYLIAALLFLICLPVGFVTSRQMQASASHLPDSSMEAAGAKFNGSLSEQVNVLLIAVDDLTLPMPELLNIWWFAYSPNNPLTILTMYPSIDGQKEKDHLIEKAFLLEHDKSGKRFLGNEIQSLFAKQEIPWNYYIVIDLTALEAFQKVSGIQLRPAGNIDWETMCWRIYAQSNKIELNSLKDYYSRHSLSDQSPVEMITFWQEVINRKNNRLCNFPQLQNSSVIAP